MEKNNKQIDKEAKSLSLVRINIYGFGSEDGGANSIIDFCFAYPGQEQTGPFLYYCNGSFISGD